MEENQRKLTGTLTLEGTVLDIDASRATIAWIQNDALTQGNTLDDGNSKDRYVKQYFVPLDRVTLPQGKDWSYIKKCIGNPQYDCYAKMIIEPNLSTRVEILEPLVESEESWGDLLKGLPEHPIEALFEKMTKGK